MIPSIEDKSNTNQIFINSILKESSHLDTLKNDIMSGSGNMSGNIPSEIISGGMSGDSGKKDEVKNNKTRKRKIILLSSSEEINECDEKK